MQPDPRVFEWVEPCSCRVTIRADGTIAQECCHQHSRREAELERELIRRRALAHRDHLQATRRLFEVNG